MKKHFKGFTLIECLIALAILGIASLTMAQIYASVARRNKNNHLVNTSISNQMAYVENYTKSETIPIYFGGADGSGNPKKDTHASGDHKPPHTYTNDTNNKSTTSYVKITRIDASKSGSASRDKDQVYSFPVDTFVLLSRDSNDISSGATSFSKSYEDHFKNSSGKDKENNLRYKYLTGHTS